MAASLNTSPRAVARNAASGYITLALGSLLGFVLTPVLLRELGEDGFGTWALILGTLNYLALLESGIGLATISRTAAAESAGPAALSDLLSAAQRLLLIITGVGVLATAGMAMAFPVLFDVPAGLRGDAQTALLCTGLAQCLNFMTTAHTGALMGLGRQYVVNTRGFAITSSVSIAQIALVISGGGLVALAVAQLTGACVAFVVYRRSLRRALPDVRIRLIGVDRTTTARVFALGWRNGVNTVANLVAFGSDVVLVGLILDPRAAAAYAVAFRGYNLISRLATMVAFTVGPVHAHAAAHGTAERRSQIFLAALGVSMAIALPAAIGVGWNAEALLDLWLAEVPDGSASVLLILCVALALQMPGVHAQTFLINAEHSAALMRVMVVAAAVNVIVSVSLTATLGVVGPALGTLTSVILFDVVLLPAMVARRLGQTYVALLSRTLRPLLVPTVLLLGVLTGGSVLQTQEPALLATLGLGFALFAGAWYRGPGRTLVRIVRQQPA